MVSLNKIVQAKRKISAFVYKTPFAFSPRLSEICGAKVWLKEELIPEYLLVAYIPKLQY